MFNVIYYREFTDFMTINVIFGYSSVSEGLSTSSLALLKPQDLIVVADLILVAIGFITRFLKVDPNPIPKKQAVAMTSFSVFMLLFNIVLGEISRRNCLPGHLTVNTWLSFLG